MQKAGERDGRGSGLAGAEAFRIGVIVPTYRHANDRVALDILQKEFPKHRVVGIDSMELIRAETPDQFHGIDLGSRLVPLHLAAGTGLKNRLAKAGTGRCACKNTPV